MLSKYFCIHTANTIKTKSYICVNNKKSLINRNNYKSQRVLSVKCLGFSFT